MRISGRPLLLQFAWHVLAILIFLCLPLVQWKAPWWDLPRHELIAIAVLIAGYGAAALAVMAFARAGTPRAFGRAMALAFSIFGVFLLLLLLSRLHAPRYLLVPVFLAIAVLAPLVVAPRVAQLSGIAVLAVVLLAVAGFGVRRAFGQQQKTGQVLAPGTSMVFPGIADDEQRAEIVDYVMTTSKVGGQ